MKIQGKTILITGGASGIGLEAAKQFLALGNRVIITGRNKAKLQAAQELYPDLKVIQSDVSRPEDASALFDQMKIIGGIDILYNNAGVGVAPLNLGRASEKHLEGATYEMEVNYLSVVRLNNLFLEMLESRDESAIINTTSILSIVPANIEATYSASKTALAFYTKSLREHLRIVNSSIKVFELVPPLVDTDMVAARTEKKISVTQLITELIDGIQKDRATIKVGDTKVISFLNRLYPKLAFALVNPKKSETFLK